MSVGDLLFLLALTVGLSLLGMGGCLWMMKKAGIKPSGSFTRLLYDNCTGGVNANKRHCRYFKSKKGGKLSVETVSTRGTLYLEFYTEDGVLCTWQTGDPPGFTVELPPGKRVDYRGRMDHFSGSITFR